MFVALLAIVLMSDLAALLEADRANSIVTVSLVTATSGSRHASFCGGPRRGITLRKAQGWVALHQRFWTGSVARRVRPDSDDTLSIF